jgi:hypothetical protein
MKAHRVAELIGGCNPSRAAIFDGTTDGDQVTVKNVYVPSINLEPSSSIHARSPCTQWGYQTRPVVIIKVSGGSI